MPSLLRLGLGSKASNFKRQAALPLSAFPWVFGSINWAVSATPDNTILFLAPRRPRPTRLPAVVRRTKPGKNMRRWRRMRIQTSSQQ